MTTAETFAKNLKTTLEKKHKTQRELAKYVGTTEATVSRWVTGKALPRTKALDKICQHLMCSPNELMYDTGPTRKKETTEEIIGKEVWARPLLLKLILAAIKASDEDIEACLALLKRRSRSANKHNSGGNE